MYFSILCYIKYTNYYVIMVYCSFFQCLLHLTQTYIIFLDSKIINMKVYVYYFLFSVNIKININKMYL